MPTGYTGNITLGTTLKDFALSCSNIKDEAVILEVESYLTELVDKQLILVNKLKSMNKKEKIKWFNSEKQKRKDDDTDNVNRIRKMKVLRDIYENLLDKVKYWKLPSAEYTDLKIFMTEQIESSIKHDCDYEYWERELNEPYPEYNEDYLQKILDRETKTLTFYLNNYQEKKDDVDTRNIWIKGLLESFEGK